MGHKNTQHRKTYLTISKFALSQIKNNRKIYYASPFIYCVLSCLITLNALLIKGFSAKDARPLFSIEKRRRLNFFKWRRSKIVCIQKKCSSIPAIFCILPWWISHHKSLAQTPDISERCIKTYKLEKLDCRTFAIQISEQKNGGV